MGELLLQYKHDQDSFSIVYRHWDGIDKVEWIKVADLTIEQAKYLDNNGLLKWRHSYEPKWSVIQMKEEKEKLLKRLEEIDYLLRGISR